MSAPTERDRSNKPAGVSTETLAGLRNVPILSSLDGDSMQCLAGARERWIEAGHLLVRQGESTHEFCILLQGSLRIGHVNAEGREQTMYVLEAGASFGEVPLLANIPSPANFQAVEPTHLLELDEDQFWNLMTQCPGVRKAILGNMAMRLAKVQEATFQQEKMASLGTLAAGLMHELNNPGAAARRASAQLRENLMRMHRLSSKFARTSLSDDQKQCMYDLQAYALSPHDPVAVTSLAQSDAEEALSEWMQAAEIENAWQLAPTLVAIGLDPPALECARHAFSGVAFSDALNWLEALVSSMQLVGVIEESIGRVTELVSAVKSYAYEGRGDVQTLDVNRSILATLIILGHKLREKQIVLSKDLTADLPMLRTDCHGLNQIWTNLLDNAIDAAPEGGRITLKTWSETRASNGGQDASDVCISVADNGGGIPLGEQTRIFDSFYTTKPAGIGTGMGLGIVHRIVEQFGGTIRFSSIPGETEFVVRLPNRAS